MKGFHFAQDWVRETASARRFLPSPETDAQWLQILAQRESHRPPPLSSDALAEMVQFNLSFGNGGALPLIADLGKAETLVVVTGQQPNLLASPLYILLKALSAHALARRLETLRGGRRVVPLFWVASDDSDFTELRDSVIVDGVGDRFNLGHLVSRGGAPEGSPAFEWVVAPSEIDALQRAVSSVRDGSGNLPANPLAELMHHVLRADAGPASFESLFCRTLSALLGDAYPVVFAAPRMTWIRRGQHEILRRTITESRPLAAELNERGETMRREGYLPLLSREPDQLDMFYLHERRRLSLLHRSGEIVAVSGRKSLPDVRFSEAELLEALTRHPERFSPNVVTRPLVQDLLLPTAAYIGGPGEISYLAQLAPAYERFEVFRPAVTLRASALLVPATVLELLKMSASPAEPATSATEPLHSRLMKRLLAEAPETGLLHAALLELEQEIVRRLHGIRTSDHARGQAIRKGLEKTERAMLRSLERLRRRLWKQIGAESGSRWSELRRAVSLLALDANLPQERLLAPHSFLSSHSPPDALARRLAQTLDFHQHRPQVVVIGS